MFAHAGIRDFAALLVATVLVWSQGGSNAAHADPNAGAREIYELSDLSAQIRPVLAYAIEALVQHQNQFTAEQFDIAIQVLREHLSSEKLEAHVLKSLEKRANSEHVDEALEWLRTPLGGKTLRARIAIHSPVDPLEMASFVEEKQANPPSQKRLKLTERYEDAARLHDMTSATVLMCAYGVAAMADALKPEHERLGREALLKSMTSQRALLEPIFDETSTITSQFIFRDFSDEEIEAVVAFSESDAGSWYLGTTSTAFLEALQETTASLGEVFLLALPARTPS